MVRSIHLDCSCWSVRAARLSLAFILLCWDVCRLRAPILIDCEDTAVFEICSEDERCGEQSDVLGYEHIGSKSAMDGICLFSSQQSESETSDLEQFCYAFDNWQGGWLGRIASCISGA